MGFSSTQATSIANSRANSNSVVAGSTRNQCYAPNGPNSSSINIASSNANTSSSRSNNSSSFVSNVLSTMANQISQSSQSATSTLLGHLRSWQRSRRLRALGKQQQQSQNCHFNSFTSATIHPSMNNLCYQSMMSNNNNNNHLNKSCSDLYYRQQQQQFPVVSYHRNYSKKKRNNVSSLRSDECPGGDAIAMQLVSDRVMINENQLYSMHHNHPHHHLHPHHHHQQPLYRTLSDNCYVSLDPPEIELTTTTSSSDLNSDTGSSEESLNSQLWYYGKIDRERATALVSRACTGSFLVRSSGTFSTSYALTVKVPADHSHTGVCHYLILKTEEEGKYKIKGFTKEFDTVQSLIIHHTIMKEQLPCTLKLQQHPVQTSNSSSNSTSNSTLASSKCHFYNTVKSTTASPSQSSLYGNFYTYGKGGTSSKKVQEINCEAIHHPVEDDELMVDVDLDPTYQQILDNFRKVMAQCS